MDVVACPPLLCHMTLYFLLVSPVKALYIEHTQTSSSLFGCDWQCLLLLGKEASIVLYEQTGISPGGCCRMFGIVKVHTYPWILRESLCVEQRRREVDIPSGAKCLANHSAVEWQFRQKDTYIGIAHPAI